MTSKERLVPFLLHYIFDAFLLYLIILLIIDSSLSLFFKFLLLYAVGSIPFVFLFIRRKALRIVQIALLLPIPIALSWLLGFSMVFSIMISVVIGWRAALNWKNSMKQNMEIIVAITASISLVWFLFFPKVSEAILLLPAVQVGYMIVLKNYHRHLQERTDRPFHEQSVFYTTAVLGVSGMAYFSFPLLAEGFKRLLGSILYFFFFLLSKPLFLLYSLLPISEGSKQKAEEVANSWGQKSEVNETIQNPPPNQDWMLWVIGIILLLAVLFYFRKRMIFAAHETIPDPTIQHAVSLRSTAPKAKTRFWNSPSDEARKIYVQFEKKMSKLGLARTTNESVSEWLCRLDVPLSASKNIIDCYNKVRYGGQTLQKEEISRFKKETRTLAEQWKRIQKESTELQRGFE